MSGSRISSEGLDARRRRLLFRSWHRGIREMDLVLGRFAEAGSLHECFYARGKIFKKLSECATVLVSGDRRYQARPVDVIALRPVLRDHV